MEWLGEGLQIGGGVAMATGLAALFGWAWAALVMGAIVVVVGIVIEAQAADRRASRAR